MTDKIFSSDWTHSETPALAACRTQSGGARTVSMTKHTSTTQ